MKEKKQRTTEKETVEISILHVLLALTRQGRKGNQNDNSLFSYLIQDGRRRKVSLPKEQKDGDGGGGYRRGEKESK